MLNKEKEVFQYKSGDLVYIILPLTSPHGTSPRKVPVKYVELVIIYKIIDPNSFLLCTLDGKLSLGLFEHERLKPAIKRTHQGNVITLPQLKEVLHVGFKVN